MGDRHPRLVLANGSESIEGPAGLPAANRHDTPAASEGNARRARRAWLSGRSGRSGPVPKLVGPHGVDEAPVPPSRLHARALATPATHPMLPRALRTNSADSGQPSPRLNRSQWSPAGTWVTCVLYTAAGRGSPTPFSDTRSLARPPARDQSAVPAGFTATPPTGSPYVGSSGIAYP